MTFKIGRSTFGASEESAAANIAKFEEAVAAHAAALNEWSAREKAMAVQGPPPPTPRQSDFVEEGVLNAVRLRAAMVQWQEVMDHRLASYPRPTHEPSVEESVKLVSGIFVPDYQIVDDREIPTQAVIDFATRKAMVIGGILNAEAAAKNAIIPEGKVRLHSMKVQAVRKKDQQRVQQMMSGEKDEKKLAALVEKLNKDTDAVLRPLRSPDENALLDRDAQLKERLDGVSLHAAILLDLAEDLTPETIDAWSMEPFPTWD